MNAKDLRDYVGAYLPNGTPTTIMPSEWQTILRALDLLVAMEESGDGLVTRLNESYVSTGANYVQWAAARIVAQDERIAKLEAERDSLKRHAEAMANAGTGQVYIEANRKAVLAYRRDHPKEEA